MSHHVGLKGQSWKEVMESFHVESSSFIQKLKTFNISNARQLVSMYCSHVESLGNFKNKYKTKKEKVRNQTTYITKFSKRKREGDRQRRRRKKGKKKKKQLPHGATPTSSLSSSFSPSFVFFPYKWDFSCFSPVSIFRPKQLDFACTVGTQPVRLVFFPKWNKGVVCIGALASTVRYEIDFLDLDHLLTLNMVAPRCVYLPFPYYFLPFTIARTPLMQLSFYKYKCLWGGVRGGSSLQERVLHTHTHTHTHIYIYIYLN